VQGPRGPRGLKGDKGDDGAGGTTDHAALTHLGYSDSGHTGFSPTLHSHSESDVIGLVVDLAGKASSIHAHAESDVTNLVSDLAAKAPIAMNGTPGVDHTSTGPTTNTFNAGESVTVMDLVYLKSDGEWWRTDADAAGTTDGLLAFSLESKTDGQAMSVALPGSFIRNDSWNWTPGAILYVDTATPGAIVTGQPSGPDDAIRVVGWAVSATVIYFMPSGLYFTHV
jgi:hypothetical protein